MVEVLVLVESNLNTSSSFANTTEVVFVKSHVDHVLGARHLFDTELVSVFWQVTQFKVNDGDLVRLAHLVVGTQSRPASDGVVACEHCLLSGFGLTAWDCV